MANELRGIASLGTLRNDTRKHGMNTRHLLLSNRNTILYANKITNQDLKVFSNILNASKM